MSPALVRSIAIGLTTLPLQAIVACSSGPPDESHSPRFTVRGSVEGLSGSGLVLRLNDTYDRAIDADGNFDFVVSFPAGTDYLVTIHSAPTHPDQRCDIAHASGSVGGSQSADVVVRCVTPLALLAGRPGGLGAADGPLTQARFHQPRGVALDAFGNLYVADTYNHKIRRVTPAGDVTTVAGDGVAGDQNGAGAIARFNMPSGIAVDRTGNLFVADYANNSIRRVTPDGTVSTFAGTSGSSGVQDGVGVDARFGGPVDIAIDASGTLYVAEAQHAIRKISAAREVTTLAGVKGTFGYRNGDGAQALFWYPEGLDVDAAGNVFVADRLNGVIRRVAPDGVVTTHGSSPGQLLCFRARSPPFCDPVDVAVDGRGRVWVSENGSRTVRRIDEIGMTTIVAGQVPNFGGWADGTGSAAQFQGPRGIALDGDGNAFLADDLNHAIRRITSDGEVTTYAGLRPGTGSNDGIGRNALFNFPVGLAADGAGNLYVADSSNHAIRRIDLETRRVTTLAGTPGALGDEDGPSGIARFQYPAGLALDGADLWVADSGNETLRIIDAGAGVVTIAGSPGQSGVVDGVGAAARFYLPQGIARATSGIVYVADVYGHTIRRVSRAGEVTLFAGAPEVPGSDDGDRSVARFDRPTGLAIDSLGNLYVADEGNHTIRKITAEGIVSTLSGLPGVSGFADGASARFASPMGVAVDSAGIVYVTDTGNGAVRRITPDGVVSTLAGDPLKRGLEEGLLPGSLGAPQGIALLSEVPLKLAVSDSLDNSLVLITP